MYKYNQKIPIIKCVLAGDGATGKTSFLKRHDTGEFEKNYKATQIVATQSLYFYTNRGPIVIRVWDTNSQKEHDLLRNGYFDMAQCGMIMFDVNSRETIENVHKWYRAIRHYRKRINIVLIGNKTDVEDRIVNAETIGINKMENVHLCHISVKSNFNIAQPLLWLAQQMSGDPKLEFVPVPAKMPPPIKQDKFWQWLVARDYQKVPKIEIEENDEDKD